MKCQDLEIYFKKDPLIGVTRKSNIDINCLNS